MAALFVALSTSRLPMADNKPLLPGMQQNNPALPDAIRDAQIILCYASQRGVPLDEEVVKTIVETGSHFASGSMTDKQETAFWVALNTLAILVSPVSVRSLRATNDAARTSRAGLSRYFAGKSPARSAVRWYTFYALSTLILLLLFQIYWLFGTSITSDIQKTNQKLVEAQAQVRKIERPAADSQARAKPVSAESPASGSSPDPDLQALKAQASGLRLQRDSSYQLLSLWSWPWQGLASALDGREDDRALTDGVIGRETARFQTSLIVLEVFQRYILPLLYGLLGTCVFVLRTLSSEIRARTYTDASHIGFRIRLYLGMLGGMVFAWFATPESANGLFMSLSPFAVAFLAGYSVELLFAVMDRFLGAFTSNTPSKTGS
jgi:hypothetical protein